MDLDDLDLKSKPKPKKAAVPVEKRREMFLKHVLKTESCWLWQGSMSSSGYGSFWDGSKAIPAHRAAHILFKGPLPAKSVILHSCDTTDCVNPEHLTAGTQKENVQDAIAKGRRPKAKEKAPKEVVSEEQLVNRYVKKVMNAAATAMVNRKDLHGIMQEHGAKVEKTATMLALDKDFYFSVVFQSAEQKYEFLKALQSKFKFEMDYAEDEAVDMVNGMKLAENMGIPLKPEPVHPFPVEDITLLPFVLDGI